MKQPPERDPLDKDYLHNAEERMPRVQAGCRSGRRKRSFPARPQAMKLVALIGPR
jgi:hypothetical protein